MSTNRSGGALRLVAWLGFLTFALVWLHRVGTGGLAVPPLDGFVRWLAEHGAATAAFALARLGLLAVAWYLLLTTLLSVALQLARVEGALADVGSVSPAFVRRLVQGAAGVTLAAGAMVSSTVVATATEEDAATGDPPVLMRRLPGDAPEDDPVTMRRVPDGVDGGLGSAERPPPAPSEVPATWTIEPGDHLWSVAASVLATAWSTVPTDEQIAPYWRTLVESNRPRLPDPDNPDLLFAGGELVVPTPPAMDV